MAQRADAADGIIDRAGTRFDVVDEFTKRTDRQVGMHRERHAVDGDHGDRRQIFGRIERKLLHLRHDCHRRAAGDINRISVVRRPCGDFGADRATRPAAILDDERLAQRLRKPVGDQSRDDVGDAARTVRDDDPDGVIWPILRPRRRIQRQDRADREGESNAPHIHRAAGVGHICHVQAASPASTRPGVVAGCPFLAQPPRGPRRRQVVRWLCPSTWRRQLKHHQPPCCGARVSI